MIPEPVEAAITGSASAKRGHPWRMAHRRHNLATLAPVSQNTGANAGLAQAPTSKGRAGMAVLSVEHLAFGHPR